MKNLLTTLALSVATLTSAYAAPEFMTVMCNMNPATALTLAAAYSDPATGKMVSDNAGCGDALAQVPTNYTMTSASAAGGGTAAFVTYLFSPGTTH